MSQKNGFGSGFVLGSIVGGVVGGLLGTLLGSYRDKQTSEGESKSFSEGRQAVRFTTEEGMELARHSLEDKIAQLNLAIDDVRQQLDTVNPNQGERD